MAAVENGEVSELTLCARDSISPIALDLPGKGRIQRVAGDFQVDLDADGIKESLTEWFAPTAGILISRDASGQVTGDHLFGNVDGLHADGFAKLATLDANGDGQIAGDELASLAIWVDRNSDTVIDKGEVSDTGEHDIVSLPLQHYKYIARAQRGSGESILMEDVWFALAPIANASN